MRLEIPLFQFAALDGNMPWAARLLHDDAVDINAAADSRGTLLLHRAVQQDQLDIAQWVTKHGADPNVLIPTMSTMKLYDASTRRRALKGHVDFHRLQKALAMAST